MNVNDFKTNALTDFIEADKLAEEILRITSVIPQSIINGSGSKSLKEFKDAVTKARRVASGKNTPLNKLRDAFGLIQYYYTK